MIFRILRLLFANFPVSGGLILGILYGIFVGLLLFGWKFPLLILLCIFLAIGLVTPEFARWWRNLSGRR